MSNVVPFKFDQQDIRVIERDGEPWFVAKDVASVLGYSNPLDAVRRHCKAAQHLGGARFTHPSNLDPQTVIIPERDLYRLIMRSKLPAAERFEDWVVSEVLPSIRKTGGYGEVAQRVPTSFSEALFLAAQQQKAIEDQQAQIEEMKPAVAALDQIANSEGLLTRTKVAKLLGQHPHKFCEWLRQNGWTYRRMGDDDDLAYQDRLNSGYLAHKTHTYKTQDGRDKTRVLVYVTSKGLAKLGKLFGKQDAA